MLTLKTKADLEALIAEGERESLTLEFKAGAALANEKKGEIGKDVSAMANAAGGQIIYGIKERDHVAAELQPVDVRRFNHEWLEKVIRNNISPAVEGVTIDMIDVGPEPSDVAFVVSIPPATVLAPHQAKSDLKYYRRHNFMADPMADYEIREAMRRVATPQLTCKYTASRPLLNHYTPHEICSLSIELSNRSPEPALYVAVSFYLDARMKADGLPRGFTQANAVEHPNGLPLCSYSFHISAPRDFPVFREISQQIADFRFEIPADYKGAKIAFGHRIACPGYTEAMLFDVVRDQRRSRSGFLVEFNQDATAQWRLAH